MYLERITAPAAEPVSLSEAKEHLRVISSATEEDDLITSLTSAARELCEDISRRSFVTQTLELTLDAWPVDFIQLPLRPIASITSVKYTDSNGDEHTVASTNYILSNDRLFLASGYSWPSDSLQPFGAIKVRYVAGYGDAVAVPNKYKQAILLTVGHWFQNREAVVLGDTPKELPLAVKALLLTDRGY